MKKEKSLRFSEDDQGTVWFNKRLCVPNNIELKKILLKEAHEERCISFTLELQRCIKTSRRCTGGLV